MLTPNQIILLKMAQRDAGLDDTDYRDAIATVTGMPDCRSAKDARLTDGHLDKLLKWFEAIYWAEGRHPIGEGGSKVFQTRDYWKNKNPRQGQSSRDRFTSDDLDQQIATLEQQLAELGCGLRYCQAIQNNLRTHGSFTKANYIGALSRTLKSKQRKAEDVPF